MPLAHGTRLGAYEVLSLLGIGGMGEVYRAQDHRLNRQVALKVLPATVAADAERLARFEREAQVLAALNHPHIAGIYGVEDSGGTPALVIGLVDGETLADRIARGPIPLDEALPIARQIAEALEAAHEQGIIHRDLKPANVKVRPDGTVKVLDFGLAKAVEPAGASTSLPAVTSPTITSPAVMTAMGVLLGTAAYMSPEQASGKPVDKRTDIWSYGVVLFEMLTGAPLFGRSDSVAETLADVLRAPIDLSQLASNTPPRIRVLVERCLDRDVRTRLRDIGEARVELDRVRQPLAGALPGESHRSRAWRLPVAIAGLVATIGMTAAATFWFGPRRSSAAPYMRFADDAGSPIALNSAIGPAIAVAPDGSRVAFVTRAERGTGAATHLAWRALTNAAATPLPGTDGASAPFFSPDGRWVGFFADRKLKKVSIDGGTAVTVCETDPFPRSGSWGEDGNILFAAQRTPVMRVSAFGGTPEPATTLASGEVTNRSAQMLPGGHAFLFTASRDNNVWEDATVWAQTIATGERRLLVKGAYFGRFVSGRDGAGFLLYMKGAVLFAAPMNTRRLELTGPAIPVADDVAALAQNGFAHLDVARNGAVVYVARAGQAIEQSLATFDRTGKLEVLPAPPGAYSGSARPSPDGTRIAVRVTQDGATDLAVYEVATRRVTRLTFGRTVINDPPVWTPDGSHIVFSVASAERTGPGLFWIAADGSGDPQQLLEAEVALPYSFSPDGTRLAYYAVQSASSIWGIWTLPMDLTDPQHPKAGRPELFLESKARLANPAFSPDGRWIAYASAETSPPQIFVRPFTPGATRTGGRWQVSTRGGQAISWLTASPQLVYSNPQSGAQIVSYTVHGDSFVAGSPEPWGSAYPQALFAGPPGLMPDGSRFVAIVTPSESGAATESPTQMTFLLGFGDELARRLSSVADTASAR